MELIVSYLLIINAIGIYVMWEDKRRAGENAWRIPERVLFGVSLLGGAYGTLYGMYRFRHKTKHMTFKVGFPVIAALETGLLLWLVLH